ncbi:hypothetical protein BJ165DRAFT_1407932 [Panaeolus papilionaceus]|nr:hypothetical protein BJ165DRAFT_1407932 [Panaeolus papilionaceus]
MLLHLSSDDVWKASYMDEAGRLWYKFDTSSSLSKDEMTLYRFDPPASDATEKEMVGQILYNGSTKDKTIIIEMDNAPDSDSANQQAKGVLVGEVLRQSGPCGFTIGSYPSHAFTASDGNEYEWIFGYGRCSLHPIPIAGTTRETDTDLIPPVMTLKHREFHLLAKSVSPTLEVEKGYESILDTALLTLGYLERVRKRDVARRQGPAFFGGGSWAKVPGAF